MTKSLSTLAYPFWLLYVLCVVFSFCDDHQFIDVSRCEQIIINSSWNKSCLF